MKPALIKVLVCEALSEVSEASLFLTALYERLRDKRQRTRATAAGRMAREELRRKRVLPPTEIRRWSTLQETEAERQAWVQVIGGLLLLNMMAALSVGMEGCGTSRMIHVEWNAALQAALTGFDTAFDRDLVQTNLEAALELALDRISRMTESAWVDLPPQDLLGPDDEPLHHWIRRFWSDRIGARLTGRPSQFG